MAHFHEFYHTMKDGTVKQINPFTGTEVWTVPERGFKPITNASHQNAKLIQAKASKKEERYCKFCIQNFIHTPPEKERLILQQGKYAIIAPETFEQLNKTDPLFRRVPNLFEIVTYNYWEKNYHYKIPQAILDRKHTYLATEKGKNHVLKVLNQKLKATHIEPDTISDEVKLDEYSNAFFAGCHELIIGGRHFTDDAQYDNELCSAGDLSIEEHFQYTKFTIHAMEEIFQKNRFVRYVSIFQNWLAPAGASFDHLHKQLVGLDEWGTSIEKEIGLVRNNRNIYNEFGANFAAYNDLVFAENDYATAFADIGHRFPTIAIFSKSIQPYPSHQDEEEVRGMSDLLHACHKAMGKHLSCNEEWYYTPYDTIDIMPWHILLKWRINTPAGFEGGTKIYINPISPVQVRDEIVPRLYELREAGEIKNIRIAEECKIIHNPLQYYRFSGRY